MKKNYNMLKEKALPLTDRELSMLSVAVTMLQTQGVDPDEQSTYVRSNCFLTPCMIPHGKYCVTGPERWNLLGGQDKTAQKKNKLFFKNLEPYDSRYLVTHGSRRNCGSKGLALKM